MLHEPSETNSISASTQKKARLGVWLFFLYTLVYSGFVAIGVTNYELMGKKVLGEQTLAIVYGIGLIVFAVVLGVIYNFLCTRYEDKMDKEEKS